MRWRISHQISNRSVTKMVRQYSVLYKGMWRLQAICFEQVKKINAKEYINWRHVRTDENPADLGRRRCATVKLPGSWLAGPSRLSNSDDWPANIHHRPSKESEAEAKTPKEALVTALLGTDDLDRHLENHSLWKAVRVFAWIVRFIQSCKSAKAERTYDPLMTTKTENAFNSGRSERYCETEQFKEDKLKLDLQKSTVGLYEC